MLGLGGTELLIILGIVLVLFGPTLFAFWLGYTVGKKRSPGVQPSAPAPSSAVEPPAESLGPSATSHSERTDGEDTPTDPNSEERAQ